MSFQGKVVVITGAGLGIGFEIAQQLGLAGAKVVLNDVDPKICQVAVTHLSNQGINCLGQPGDAGDVQFLSELIANSVQHFGQVDIAIANAGVTLFGDFFSYSAKSFFEVLRVNLGGSFFLAQQASLQMRQQPQGGSILFLSSAVGHQAHKNLAAYASTKAGLEMLAKNLVLELSPYKININCIAPGATLTERTLAMPDFNEEWSKLTPLGRPADVQDIATAALFLVSSQSRHITGQSLVIDGGWTSISPQPKT